ncbi:nuclear protein DGCR14 [Nemania sp. NC0429]|nr:nuclear protein DGCR14 [Nemania sp. NC0429]
MEHDISTSTALTRKRDNLELMPPPPPPKRIKRPKKVISEDSYTDALSQIIARDFFPGLLESETQQEYLDALESRDPEWISSASRRLQHVMTPGRRRARRGTSLAPGSQTPRSQTPGSQTPGSQTPRGFVGDTPSARSSASVRRGNDNDEPEPEIEIEIEIDTNMSLSAFQSKYTSEDNESFYKLLDKQNSKRAEKYAWLWAGNKLPSKMQLAQRRVETKLLEAGRSLADDGFAKKDKLAIRDKGEDDRPARPDAWRSVPNNALMFVPDAVPDGTETLIQAAEAASRAPPKAVNYQNTRLAAPRIGDDDQSVPPSPSLSAVRDAIAGRRRPGSEATSTAAGGSETPRVNGYAFVDDADEEPERASPPPAPGLGIDLGPGDATPNPFVIQAQSRREALHHSMVDRISQSRRDSSRLGATGKVDATPVPRFPSSPRVTAGGGLTPAAQRLWSKIGSSAGVTPRTPFGQSTPKTTTMTPTMLRAGRGSRLKHVSK